MKKLLLILLFALPLSAQNYTRQYYSGSNPTGNCANGTQWINTTLHTYRFCDNNTWRVLPASAVSATIGSAVTGGTATAVLFVDGSGNLGQDGTAFNWNNTTKSLNIVGTNSGYGLSINTATTDGLFLTRSTAGRTGIVIDAPAGQQATVYTKDGGVGQWLFGKNTDNTFLFYNVPNSLNQLVLNPGTIDTAYTSLQGALFATRTTTNNGATGAFFAVNDNNVTGTPGGTQVTGLAVAYVAGNGATQEGNGIGISSNVTITASGAHASNGNEFASYLASSISNSSNAIRQWGAFDFNSHSSISVADDYIQGGSLVTNRYNTGANRNGSGGLFVYTKPNQGAGAHIGATTYPLQVGIQIAGWSGAAALLGNSPNNATLSSRTAGYTIALRIGGAGSGWDSPYLSDKSRITTGISVEDIDTYGINFQNPYQGTTPATPTMMVGSGATWKDGIDWDAASFSGYSARFPKSALITVGSNISPSGGFGAFSNWIANSEDLTAAGWINYCTAATLTANSADFTAPDGSTHSTKIVANVPGGGGCLSASGILFDNGGTALTVGQSYTASIWLKGASGGESVNFCINDGNCTNATVVLTTYWRRYVYTTTSYVTDTNTRYAEIKLATNLETFYAWGAQVENSAIANVYLKTGASNNKTSRVGGVVNGNQFVNGFSRKLPQTFALLPTCDATVEGATASITDSNTIVWGATIAGSSTNHVLGFCNGTNWTVAGK